MPRRTRAHRTRPPSLVLPLPESVRPGPDPFPDEWLLRELADAAEGFAGLFVENTTLVALSADPTTSDQVRAAVEGRMAVLAGGLSQAEGGAIDVRSALHTFRELERWRNLVFYDLSSELPDWVDLDLDERDNVVVVGLPNEARVAEAREILARAGVPASALSLEVRSAPIQDSGADSVINRLRPISGGIKIQTDGNGQTPEICTSGIMALYGSTEVVSTASHCSNAAGMGYMWNVGSAVPEMHQEFASTGNSHISTEAFDPLPWSCSSGFVCRRTDHVFYGVDDSLAFSYGTIPRIVISGSVPFGFDTGDGPKEIDDTNGPWEIIVEPSVFPSGTLLYKLGGLSGLTSGHLKSSCVSKSWPEPKTRVTCVSTANYHSRAGDSGAPVFSWDGTSNEIRLYGTHFARGNGVGSDTFAIYNPMTSVRADFNAATLKVFDPPLTVVTQGASPLPPDVECDWWATVNGGVPPYTSYVWSGVLSGTGPFLSGSLGEGQSGFLYVTVTDSEPTSVKDSLFVEVEEGAFGCEN